MDGMGNQHQPPRKKTNELVRWTLSVVHVVSLVNLMQPDASKRNF